jgi:hypothetical protein
MTPTEDRTRTPPAVRPFTTDVRTTALDDLRRRVRVTPWPERETAENQIFLGEIYRRPPGERSSAFTPHLLERGRRGRSLLRVREPQLLEELRAAFRTLHR